MLRYATLVFVALVAALAPGAASAHTGFDSSSPAEGETVAEPVETITLTFTGDPQPADDPFVVLDPQGAERLPDRVDRPDATTFVLGFDEPLAGGTVAVRWAVVAADGHPISGAFSFVVDAPTAEPATTVAPATDDPVAAAAGDATTGGSSDAPATGSAGDATTGGSSDAPASADPSAEARLQAFLDDAGAAADEPTIGLVGRTVAIVTAVLGIGVLSALAAGVVRGAADQRFVLSALAVVGGALVLASIAELAGVVDVLGDGVADAVTTSAGFAVVLRIVGGALLIALVAVNLRRAEPRHGGAVSLSAAVVDPPRPVERVAGRTPSIDVGPAPFVGATLAALVLSFWFDGHTATEGPRVLHAVVDAVHVAAGSVWVGGVVAMTAVAWRRHRLGRPSGAGAMVVRFSSLATVALAAVLVAGVVMTFFVADVPGDLTGTEWGRVLLLKSAFVAVAMGLGGYHHLFLRPRIVTHGADERLDEVARTALTVEAIVLCFVLVVTGSLVAASIV